MLARLLLAPAVLLLLCSPLIAEPSKDYRPDDTSWRTISFRLIRPDGSPAPFTTGTLWFTNREAMYMDAQWDFQTNAKGKAAIKFATRYYAYKDVDPRSINHGSYLVVPPGKGHAGTITGDYESSEIPLEKGKTIHGRVVDQNGKGLPNAIIGTWYDLHVDTHTGCCGDVLDGEARTDAQGNFVMKGVLNYPITLSCQPFYNNEHKLTPGYFWSQTTIDGVLHDDRIDEIEIPTTATQSNIIIHCEPSPGMTFNGTVLNMDDKPLSGATVLIGYSAHKEAANWGDWHMSKSVTTDHNGKWKLDIPTKWTTFGEVRFEDGPNRSFSAPLNLDTTTPQTIRLEIPPLSNPPTAN